jgi:hypothetical protein
MMLRSYSPHDYEEVSGWWRARGLEPIAEVLLPTTGLIAPGVAASFLYLTNSSVAWMAWTTSNPTASQAERDEMLDAIVRGLLRMAEERGYKVMFTNAEPEQLKRRYERLGFMEGDKNVKQYWRSTSSARE